MTSLETAPATGLPICQALVIGWAGCDHLASARAIAVWYIERKTEDGWDAECLEPILVALDEVIP